MCLNQDDNHSGSGFVFGLILGAIIGVIIAILIYRNDREEVIAKFKQKFEEFLNQFNSQSPPSKSKPSKTVPYKKPLIATITSVDPLPTFKQKTTAPPRKPKMFLKPKK